MTFFHPFRCCNNNRMLIQLFNVNIFMCLLEVKFLFAVHVYTLSISVKNHFSDISKASGAGCKLQDKINLQTLLKYKMYICTSYKRRKARRTLLFVLFLKLVLYFRHCTCYRNQINFQFKILLLIYSIHYRNPVDLISVARHVSATYSINIFLSSR